MTTWIPKNKVLTLLLFFFVVLLVFSTFDASTALAASTTDVAPVHQTLECWDGYLSIKVDHCLVELSYYVFFVPAAWVMIIAGSIFDSMMAFSLSSQMMDQPFVTEAWKAVRDIVNLSFIFVLLYIAISTILSLGDHKKLLVNLIIVGLLINFSAFFTKVVIDASNILAIEFYNAIGAPPGTSIGGIGIEERSISAVFITGFDPQKLTGAGVFNDWVKEDKNVLSLMFVYLSAGIVTFLASFALLKVGILFLARTISFWFLIIVSPLAFMAFILPGQRGKFEAWWGELIGNAMIAPVFLFFMFIIAKIIQSDFLSNIFRDTKETGFFDIILSTILVFAVLYFIMMKAVSVTMGLSKESGAMAGKAIGAAAGLTKFTPMGALRGALVRTGGRVAAGLAASKTAKGLAARAPRIGGAALGALDAAGGGAYEKYRAEEVRKRVALSTRIGKQGGGETKFAAAVRQERFFENLEKPSGLGRVAQIVTSTTKIDRDAAKEIREGKTGKKETDYDKLVKGLGEELKKQKEKEKDTDTTPAGESEKTKPTGE